MRLVVDARKAFDSGIGTYIRNVLPRVLERLRPVSARVLISPGTRALHAYLSYERTDFVEIEGKPLSVGDQWILRRAVGAREIFWATSLAHPLFLFNRCLVATVHDVAHLVLGRGIVGGRLVQAASRLYLESLRLSAGLLMFNSEFTRREFHRFVGAQRANEAVTPLGVAEWWFSLPAGQGASLRGRPYFICVGNIRPHKNLGTLFRAFRRVMNSIPHDLVIIGQREGFRVADPYFSDALAALGDRAHFLGHVDDPTLGTWVAGADAMVLPSLYEGFGLPALEALAAGCPVLCSTAGALPEVCAGNARLFDPNSWDSLAEALLEQVAMDAKAQAEARSRGVAHARKFDWEHTADLTASAILRYAGTETLRIPRDKATF